MTEAFQKQIEQEARQAVTELLAEAKLKKGDVFVVGCSSSEIVGGHIGKDSSLEAAQAVYAGIAPVLAQRGIWLAAQCCEHLNRALAACKCSRTFRPGELLTKPWDEWGSEDFAAIDRCGCRQASCEKLHFDEHRAFGSAYFLELGLSCQQLEQNIPALFTDPACGHVLRAKGFVQDENGWVELNATADGLTANAILKGQEVLIVIGEGLEKERIEARLKG